MNPKPIQLNSKKHFLVLDGLRGIAALAVVVFHFLEMYIPHPQNPIAHGYLAVDFFFCLSGFVVAYAYDDRIDKMSINRFFRLRLIRLHPLVVLGSILGLLAFMLDPFSTDWQNYSFLQISLLFLASILLIPYPIIGERAFNLFGLNAPSWTLFWEYVANLVYALFLYRLKKYWLLIMATIMAILLVYIAKTSGDMSGGWSKDNYLHGGVRIGFSFLAGMCLFRYNWIIKNKLGFPLLALLLSFAFFIPYRDSWNWISEPLLILVYFPLLLSLGAGTNLADRHRTICKFSGDISYPLYITHYFILWGFLNYYQKMQPNGNTLIWVIPSLIMIQIGIAYLASKYYDAPLRKKLNS